jgi:hypothetical protein
MTGPKGSDLKVTDLVVTIKMGSNYSEKNKNKSN